MLLTMMHSIIQYGLEAGKDVDLQQSTYDMKGQFGAMLEPTWIMAGSPSLLLSNHVPYLFGWTRELSDGI